MIRQDKYVASLEALRFLLIRARFIAHESGAGEVAALLDDAELLPEFLAAGDDRTADFRDMLCAIVQKHPGCAHALQQFDQPPAKQPGR